MAEEKEIEALQQQMEQIKTKLKQKEYKDCYYAYQEMKPCSRTITYLNPKHIDRANIRTGLEYHDHQFCQSSVYYLYYSKKITSKLTPGETYYISNGWRLVKFEKMSKKIVYFKDFKGDKEYEVPRFYWKDKLDPYERIYRATKFSENSNQNHFETNECLVIV